MMEATEKLLDKAVSEIESMLNTKTAVGEPITVGEHTLIPLVSVGFGFGGGGCQCDNEKKGECHGSGGCGGHEQNIWTARDEAGEKGR